MKGQTDSRKASLSELAFVFLKLGTTAFGGPAAHLAMMEREFVRERSWLSHEDFVDMIGASNLIPGPSSTEVAIHVGFRRAGILGLILAGICFILPAALIVCLLAWSYVRFGRLPGFQSALFGIKPVVVAIVAQAIALLIGKVIDSWLKRATLAICLILAWIGISEIAILFGAGLSLGALSLMPSGFLQRVGFRFRSAKGALLYRAWGNAPGGGSTRSRRAVSPRYGASPSTTGWRSAFSLWKEKSLTSAKPLASVLAGVAAVAAIPVLLFALKNGPVAAHPGAIFLYFLKLGSVIYGSGYVLLSFLERDVVTKLHWLTRGQLLDAVAVGQFTPGPVFTTATFIGFILAGPLGAAAATLGIFLPAFVFVGLSGPSLPKLRRSPVLAGFLDGVNAAALALMAVVLIRLGIDAIRNVPSAVICIAAFAALMRFKVNSALLVLAGGLAGICLAIR